MYWNAPKEKNIEYVPEKKLMLEIKKKCILFYPKTNLIK